MAARWASSRAIVNLARSISDASVYVVTSRSAEASVKQRPRSDSVSPGAETQKRMGSPLRTAASAMGERVTKGSRRSSSMHRRADRLNRDCPGA